MGVVRHRLPGFLVQLHPQQGRLRCRALRPQQHDGGEHVLHHPLHRAGEAVLPARGGRPDMVGPDADPADALRHRPAAGERQPPVRKGHRSLPWPGVGVVLAAGESGGGLRAGAAEQLLQGGHRLGPAPVHDAHPAAVSEHLPPVVGDPQHRAGESPQRVRQLQLQLVFQVAVQGGEGLVQQDGPGLRRQDAGQGAPLLLPAGELPRLLVRHGLQPELPQLLRHLCLAAALVPHGRGDVLPHRHVGEQGVLLEQVSHPTPLGRQVDPGGAVIQGDAVQLDVPLVRRQDTRHTFEGHGLAAPRGSQQGQRLVPGLEPDLQPEIPQLLLNVHGERHYRPPPFPARLCLASSRFTASRNTAEMAMFTSTQRRASASLSVRQS